MATKNNPESLQYYLDLEYEIIEEVFNGKHKVWFKDIPYTTCRAINQDLDKAKQQLEDMRESLFLFWHYKNRAIPLPGSAK